MLTQIDRAALATFALDTFDCDERFEDDSFVFEFEGVRLYAERKKTMFVLHVGSERIKLPRC